MKAKHLRYWIEQTKSLSKLSECVRKKFGCLIVDPVSNCLLVDGYNGKCRGGTSQCGGETSCLRDVWEIKSGEVPSIGCNHAESNAICNSARLGISVKDKWLFVNGEPCLMCAKLIHASGLKAVFYIKGGYSTEEGINYLKKNAVQVHSVEADLSDVEELFIRLNTRFKPAKILNNEVSPFS